MILEQNYALFQVSECLEFRIPENQDFDMNIDVSGGRLLMDKSHRDGSPLSRCQSDAARMRPDPVEDKVIVSDLSNCSSNKNSIGTPIKMLIAHEMSRELNSNYNSPSLVAKLMGLDVLPRQEPDSLLLQKCHSHHYCHSGIPLSYRQQDDEMEMQMPHELHKCLEHSEYKDVYEVVHQSHQCSYTKNKLTQRGRHYENPNEKKMALVREKFIEAKRLVTDERLRQSKRFQDALDVLSSNRDLLLKLLQEPNFLINQNQFDLSSVPPSETKRITVLKPCNKFLGSLKNKDQTTSASDADQKVGWDKSKLGFSPPDWKFVDNPTRPTRIVVLKPSNGKLEDIKAVVTSDSLSPRFLHTDDFLEEPEDDDSEKSREAPQHRRDDTLLSSVLSNGYIGDESSFHKSECEDVVGSLSDSEVVSTPSRHSWDYIHRVGSPFSSSSFGRASYSPESSACREAKKRLSERWAMAASNGSCVEQRNHVTRSSSTLGEMLRLSDPKGSVICEESAGKKQEARGSTTCSINDLTRDENVDNSPVNLLGSKSVPVSSTVVGDVPNLKVSHLEVGGTDTPKEVAKSKSIKTSFREKVSNFFLRSKRSDTEKASPPQSKDELDRFCGSTSDSATGGVGTKAEEGYVHAIQASSNTMPLRDSNGVEANDRMIFPETGLCMGKPVLPRNLKHNQDQPSPVSVLEQPLEEDDNVRSIPCNVKPYLHGANLPDHSLRSNLIDKSPPIGSLARTLSLENSFMDKRTDYALPHSLAPNGTVEGEQDWIFFVQSLLSAVGLGSKVQLGSYIGTWHSPDSSLDPSLRDRYVDLNEKGITHEGKRRQMRSTRKLVFDCVNAVLGDMTGDEPEMSMRGMPDDGAHKRILEVEFVDQVWSRVREWFSVEVSRDDGDGNSLVVEKVVRNEVVGKGWAKHMRVETDNIGKELEGKLMEDLVHEALVELTGRL